MSRYTWPSWCRSHRRPHIRVRLGCITNRERREFRRRIATGPLPPPIRYRRDADGHYRRVDGGDR